MEPPSDYYAYRATEDRLAELRRDADAFRLTRVLAEQHESLFPRARRLAAGLVGLMSTPHPSRTSERGAVAGPTRRVTRAGSSPQPCGC